MLLICVCLEQLQHDYLIKVVGLSSRGKDRYQGDHRLLCARQRPPLFKTLSSTSLSYPSPPSLSFSSLLPYLREMSTVRFYHALIVQSGLKPIKSHRMMRKMILGLHKHQVHSSECLPSKPFSISYFRLQGVWPGEERRGICEHGCPR